MAGIRLANGSLDPATGVAAVIGFAIFIQRFFDPVRDLVLQYTMFQRAMAGAERIFEVLDTEPEITDKPDAIELDDIRGEVQFDHVGLEYVEGIPVLHDVELHVQPGETVAFVGSIFNKTKLLNLTNLSGSSVNERVKGGSVHNLTDIRIFSSPLNLVHMA